jgi:hypothetical protein
LVDYKRKPKMKTNSKLQTRHPPTLTAHISFGEVGRGPDGERFIRVNIDIAKQRRIVLLRYDDLVSGSGQALARLNALDAHLISPPAKSEFLRRLQDLGPQEPSFRVATRVGPFGKAFVLPDKVLSATKEDIETWFDDGLAAYLSWGRHGGTLKTWKTLASLAEGNSRLILALGVAFVASLDCPPSNRSLSSSRVPARRARRASASSHQHLGPTVPGRQAPPPR